MADNFRYQNGVEPDWRKNENVWAIVCFDLPTNTKQRRHDYSKFRHGLLSLGLTMSQYSVYIKYYPAGTSARHLLQYLKHEVPEHGKVTCLMITDKEWSKAFRFFHSAKHKPDPDTPEQLLLF